MALKEIFHLVAGEYTVHAPVAATPITSGLIVTMNAADEVVVPSAATQFPLGIAGDTQANAFTATVRNPESSALVMGANGASTRWTQNRVADSYDETLASGLITVYSGGGEFWTDQYATENAAGAAITIATADPLYHTIGTNADVPAGSVVNAAESNWYVGFCTGAPQALPSGVPGTDVAGSLSFGTFLRFVLNINHT